MKWLKKIWHKWFGGPYPYECKNHVKRYLNECKRVGVTPVEVKISWTQQKRFPDIYAFHFLEWVYIVDWWFEELSTEEQYGVIFHELMHVHGLEHDILGKGKFKYTFEERMQILKSIKK